MKKSEEHQKRREELKELSRIAREELQHEDLNVNQKLKSFFTEIRNYIHIDNGKKMAFQ